MTDSNVIFITEALNVVRDALPEEYKNNNCTIEKYLSEICKKNKKVYTNPSKVQIYKDVLQEELSKLLNDDKKTATKALQEEVIQTPTQNPDTIIRAGDTLTEGDKSDIPTPEDSNNIQEETLPEPDTVEESDPVDEIPLSNFIDTKGTGNGKELVVDYDKNKRGLDGKKTPEEHVWDRTIPKRSSKLLSRLEFTLNDEGNADRFYNEVKGEFIFDKYSEEWYVWNGSAWVQDEVKIQRAASFVVTSMTEEYNRCYEYVQSLMTGEYGKVSDRDKKLPDRVLHHVNYSCSDKGIKAMLNRAKNHPKLSVDLFEQSDNMLLSFKNGIFDMRECKVYYLDELKPEELNELKERYPTRYIDRWYSPTTRTGDNNSDTNKPQVFLNHLRKVFTDNTDTDLSEADIEERTRLSVDYFSKVLGYSLIGGNPDKKWIFLVGNTQNAKTTTIKIIAEVLGKNECMESILGELIVNRNGDTPKPRTARASSRTIMIYKEASTKNTRLELDSSLIKTVTGETTTEAFRGFRKDSKPVKINCLPIAATNDIPTFSGGLEPAMLERLVIIPFVHTFHREEQDPEIEIKLKAESNKIFSYMVDKCIEYLKAEKRYAELKRLKDSGEDVGKLVRGLPDTPEFWLADQVKELVGDPYYTFIEETYKRKDNSSLYFIPLDEVYTEYLDWCNSQNPKVICRLEGSRNNNLAWEEGERTISEYEKTKLKEAFEGMRFTFTQRRIDGKRPRGLIADVVGAEARTRHQKKEKEREEARKRREEAKKIQEQNQK